MWHCTNLDACLTANLFVRFNDEFPRRRLALWRIFSLIFGRGKTNGISYFLSIFRVLVAGFFLWGGGVFGVGFVVVVFFAFNYFCFFVFFLIWGWGYRWIFDRSFSCFLYFLSRSWVNELILKLVRQ